MRVVYSTAHRDHDPVSEIETGVAVAPYERPQRAEAIHDALAADPDFAIEAPTEHGLAPVRAVHDPDYLTFLESAWAAWAAADACPPAGHPRLVPQPGAARRHGPRPAADRRRRPAQLLRLRHHHRHRRRHVRTPRAPPPTPPSPPPTPCWPATSVTYALCRPPGHHAPRAAFGGYCFLNNAAIAAQHAVRRRRRARRRARHRLPPRQRHAADLLRPRRRALRLDPRRPRPRLPVLRRVRRRVRHRSTAPAPR